MRIIRWTLCVLAIHLAGSSAIAQVPGLLHYQGKVAVDGTNFTGSGSFKFALVDSGAPHEQAIAQVFIDKGTVAVISVINQGSGYTSAPAVSITGGGGSGGAATANVVNGNVVSFNVTDPGDDYISPPTVIIDPPPPGIGFSTYWSNDGTGSAGSEPTAGVTAPVDKGLYALLLGDTSLANMTPIPATVFDNPDVHLRVWFDDGSTGFQQLSPDQRIAAVGYAMLADNVPDGAITSAKIDAGAVQSYHIAPGAVAATQLARPPLSGSIDASSMALAFCSGSFDATFSTPFGTVPNITLGIESSDPKIAGGSTAYIAGKSASGFSGGVNLSQSASPVTVSATNTTEGFNVLKQVNGRPAIFFYEAGILNFVRAADANGETWQAPVVAGTGSGLTDAGWYPSPDIVGGNPAVAYYGSAAESLYYSRALDSDGSSWAANVVKVDAGPAGLYCSLQVAAGRPAVAYMTENGGDPDLLYQRATDSTGSTWPGVGISIVTNGSVGIGCRLEIINSRPAISYFNFTSNTLEYVRANDSTGLSGWSSPTAVASATVSSTAQWNQSMAIVNGNPAIAYADGALGEVRFVRATDINGTTWGPSVLLGSTSSIYSAPTLTVNNGLPIVSFAGAAVGDVFVVQASDANGTAWSDPCSIDGNVFAAPDLAIINGSPAVCFGDGITGELEYIRQPSSDFTINWIALEP